MDSFPSGRIEFAIRLDGFIRQAAIQRDREFRHGEISFAA
jgi:hypothetical protein